MTAVTVDQGFTPFIREAPFGHALFSPSRTLPAMDFLERSRTPYSCFHPCLTSCTPLYALVAMVHSVFPLPDLRSSYTTMRFRCLSDHSFHFRDRWKGSAPDLSRLNLAIGPQGYFPDRIPPISLPSRLVIHTGSSSGLHPYFRDTTKSTSTDFPLRSAQAPCSSPACAKDRSPLYCVRLPHRRPVESQVSSLPICAASIPHFVCPNSRRRTSCICDNSSSIFFFHFALLRVAKHGPSVVFLEDTKVEQCAPLYVLEANEGFSAFVQFRGEARSSMAQPFGQYIRELHSESERQSDRRNDNSS